MLEVISRDEEVELIVDGRSHGRRPAGFKHGYVARFRTRYAPGEVVAVGYSNGVQTSRASLRSAGPTRVRDGQDLAFVRVELADETGIVEMLDDNLISITPVGPASLAGFGSAAPATEESFIDAEHSTYRGRALAVIRAGTKPGVITLTARSQRHGDAALEVTQERSRE